MLCYLILALAVNCEKFDSMLCNSTCWQTWTAQYICDSGENSGCVCGGELSGEHFFAGSCKMSQHTNNVTVEIHISHCMTYNEFEESNITHMGYCPYNNLPFHENGEYDTSVDLPQNSSLLNNYMCNSSIDNYICGQQRRKGMLCGECEYGLGPAVMSYTHSCIECEWYGWLLYLTLSFVPATILCFLIILLRINILSPPLNGVVIICQVIIALVNFSPCTFLFYVHMHQASRLVLPVLTLYRLFNMDFFVYIVPPFCISNKMSILAIIALDYVVALCPLTLMAMIYLLIEIHDRGWCRLFNCLWRPFHKLLVCFRKTWDIKGSIINAFATLYVLSFTNLSGINIY